MTRPAWSTARLVALPTPTAARPRSTTSQRLVTEVRRFRADQGLRPGQAGAGPTRRTGGPVLPPHEGESGSSPRSTEGGDFSATASSSPVGAVTVELDLSGAIDVEAERRRLEKDLAVADKERAQATGKLGNDAFLAKAPAAVVEKIRARLAAAEADLTRLRAQLDRLPSG